MSKDLHFLINFLEDEFKDQSEVRIRPVFESGILKSPDLPQEYDPDSSTLHRLQGVVVHTRKKEYFFPADWLLSNRSRLLKQVQEIYDALESGF